MKIRKLGIIGSGNMGSGIAQKAAQEGLQVVMVDVEEKFVKNGIDNIKKILSEAVNRGIFTQQKIDEILKLIKGTTDKNEVKDADFVIEAVFEDIEIKKTLFKSLDDICQDKTIFATNTSSFSITDLANSVNRNDRFLGLHFFYHPAKNRLLEIIPGKNTSESTIMMANIFSDIIGKTAINVKDSPGFVVNRFFVPWLNEATRILEENIANIPTIDEVAKRIFQVPMGPFELMNITGIPIAYHSTVSLGNELGDFYRFSNCLKNQFESKKQWDTNGNIDNSEFKLIEKRLLGAVFIIACTIASDEISHIEDIDRGAKIGLRWRKGPYEMMNDYGINQTYEIVKEFIQKYPTLEMPRNLEQQYSKQKSWKFEFVNLSIKENTARILINRPEAMNAINEEVIKQLDHQFTLAQNNPNVKAIVLEGSGKAFIAGADIQYFIKKIKQKKIEDICEFTRYGHTVLNKIDRSKKPVIIKLDGLALGGGAEIALTGDIIIATERASIGFPETGIGIYPGLGGTQRTTKYIGKELAKYLIFTGKILDAKTAESIGLVDYVILPDEIEGKIEKIVKKGKISKKYLKEEAKLSKYFQNIKDCFSDKNIQSLLSGTGEFDEIGKKIVKTISFKAPIAINIANKIIDEGSKLELKKGLELELQYLSKIFSTKDALEGLNSVITRKRPEFHGT